MVAVRDEVAVRVGGGTVRVFVGTRVATASVGERVIVVTAGDKGRGEGDKLVGARSGGKAPLFASTYDFGKLMDVAARANDTDFGLGGSVWSSDPERAFRVADRINSGMVWVNKHLDVGPDTPFAGAKVEISGEPKNGVLQVAFVQKLAAGCR